MTSGLDRRSDATPPHSIVAGAQLSATEHLVDIAQDLSLARDLESIMAIVRRAARKLTAADGATFVLREGDVCFYADEDAIAPLWKGHRFPMTACISGWSMLNKEAAVIEDIYADPRVPADAYRPTFVKSLAMVPIRTQAPVGAIGNYWAHPHRASDGEVKLLRALADLTSVAMENVQLYRDLQNRIQEAREAVQARDEFIAIAAHELRTPLTAMLLQLERLGELSAKEERLEQCATRSIASARRFSALVDGLLDASRLTHGRLELDLEHFDLCEAARDVVDRFEASARRAGCQITVAAPAPVRGTWDRLRLEQVLTNLLSNAMKYGAGRPIEIGIEARNGSAHLEVRDQGPGIPPEVAAKIFERFGRSGPIRHYAGLGLGLYLAREVIRAHGGSIRFDSAPGRGCTFIIELPQSA